MNSALLEPGATPAILLDKTESLPVSSGLRRRLRAVFSFPVFIAFALMALTSLTVRGRFHDSDMWWHLKTGEVIWTTHSIPSVDLFSHTAEGSLWIPHEWLAQLSMYGAYRLGGYSGLMLWLTASASLLMVLVYALSWVYSGNAKVAFVGGVIAWFFSTVGLAIRPLVLGHLLLVVELLLLELGRTRDRRWFWGLPFLFALWVNCHASYAFGVFVLLVAIACSVFECRKGPIVSPKWAPESRRAMILASLASMAALLANPTGWKLVAYPVDTLLFQHTNLANVTEWFPLSFFDARAAGLLLILGAMIWAAGSRAVEIRLDELILVAGAAFLAIQHQRMLFVFGIVAAPVVCRLLSDGWERYDPKRDLPVANAIAIAICIALIAVSFPGKSELQAQVDKGNPVNAVKFIRKAGLSGPMLNDYGFGGYLIWAMPEHKVFVDGRADLYEWAGILAAYGRWALLEEDPQILLDRYHIKFCVLDSRSPLSHVVPHLAGWSKVYGDSLASVFVRRDAPPAGKAP